MMMSTLVHSKKDTVLPNVVGKNLNDALEELSREGLGLKKDGEEFNQNIPAGVILSQNPPAGMIIKEGKLIKVIISQGGEIVYVPDLVGKTIRSADVALKCSTLVMGEISREFSSTINKDIVISQDVTAGSKVDKNFVVNVVASNGPLSE
jgi:serine/threonine-protein kinase